MREGHSAKDNTPEINMNDSNALNKNRQLKTEISSQHLREGSPVVMMMDGEEMMINISLSKLLVFKFSSLKVMNQSSIYLLCLKKNQLILSMKK